MSDNKNMFVKGNFSWNLAVPLPDFDEFKETYRGIVDSDLATIHKEISKLQGKSAKSPAKKGKSSEEKESSSK